MVGRRRREPARGPRRRGRVGSQRPLTSRQRRLVPVEMGDGLLEAVALDEAHGVEGPTVAVDAQAVDRHDAGMLKSAGDAGLQQEACPALRLTGVAFAGLTSLKVLELSNVTLPRLPRSMLNLPKIETVYYDGKGM